MVSSMRVEVYLMDSNTSAWSEYAEEYNQNTTFSAQKIHSGLGLAGFAPLDIVKTSQSILDVGCGNGLNTFLFSEQTDGEVIGIDPVESQIQIARNKFMRSNLVFLCCEFQNLPKYITGSYDLITFFGSLDYIRINELFFGVLDYVAHIGSRCFISKFHPFWTTLYGNDVGETLGNSYFESGHEDIVQFGSSKFIRYHYTLSDFITHFTSHGWSLREFAEPKPALECSAFAYKNYEYDPILQQRMSKIPMTALFEFIKET